MAGSIGLGAGGSGSGRGSSNSVSPQPVATPSSSSSLQLSPAAGPSTRALLTPESSEEGRVDDDGDGDEDGHGIELQPLRRRRPTPAAVAAYTDAEKRAVVRKFDRRLVLFVAMLYMLSFLDRSNIGNARIAGMDADLQTDPPRADWYAWALSAFYATYIAFEWLALLWRVVPAHAFVAVLVGGWGCAAALQAVAGSYPWLVVLRALLGVGEAGFAGIPLYLARFFRRDELALRTAVFIAAAPLATSFAASLAWAILALAGWSSSAASSGGEDLSPLFGIAPWRLLFLVEGFPSVLAAVAAWRILPDTPDTARYLTRRERHVARARLAEEEEEEDDDDDDAGDNGDDGPPSPHLLADPVAWLTAAMFFLANMAYSSLPVFLPTILAAMGHDAGTAQALAAPPFLLAFVVVLATAHLSDRLRARAPLLIAHALASAAGYAVLSVGGGAVSHGLRYAAVYPAAVGFFNVVVLLIAWNLNNQRGARRQGRAFALFQVVGQCGPLVGTRLYPDGDAPLFLRGMRTMAAAMLGVAVLAGVLRVVLRRRNAQLGLAEEKASKLRRTEEDEDDEDDEVDEDGDEQDEGKTGRGSNELHEVENDEEESLVFRQRPARRRQRHFLSDEEHAEVGFRQYRRKAPAFRYML